MEGDKKLAQLTFEILKNQEMCLTIIEFLSCWIKYIKTPILSCANHHSLESEFISNQLNPNLYQLTSCSSLDIKYY